MRKSIPARLLEKVDRALFPPGIYCICCGSMIDRSRPYSLCDQCVRKFHWITGRTCSACGKALPDTFRGERCYDCMETEHSFSKGYSCLTYGYYERRVIMDFKYGGMRYMGSHFGDMMFDRMEMEIRDRRVEPDIIVPVPLGPDRLRSRGFNQSAVMGRRLAERWRDACGDGEDMSLSTCIAPVFDDRILYRRAKTPMLRGLGPADRRMALEGAFRTHEAGRRLIEGRSVLLVDDIFTTGATADACSDAVLRGGAADVILLTLASGGNRRREQE